MRRRQFSVSVALAALLAACGTKAKVTPLARNPVPAPSVGQTERGVASWYGPPYHGRQAADGEIYDMETLVAAHRTLPFQTMVRVQNLTNGKTVDVRIIDRGPFVGNRIIDLSKAAARQIELLGPGTGQVELTILSAPSNITSGLFAVQIGAFRERSNADRAQQRMQAAYGAAKIVERAGSPTPWRVLAGRETSEAAATVLAQRIRAEQMDMTQAFMVRLDP
jgi:rare lipoprotein A